MADILSGGYLNKSWTSLVFSDATELNVNAYDLAKATIELNPTSEANNRIDTATGQVVSLNFFVAYDLKVTLDKTKPAYKIWSGMIENGISRISGTCTFTDDTRTEYTLRDLSISRGKVSGSGEEAGVEFTLKCVMYCNQGDVGIF